MPDKAEEILVIAPRGLRDFLVATGRMRCLRRLHPNARIMALAAPRFLDTAQRSGYFDDIVLSIPRSWLSLLGKRFARVYDLRAAADAGHPLFRHFLRGRPLWVPPPESSLPDISWMTAGGDKEDIAAAFGLKKPYVLLLAGASLRHPEKNWLPRRYAALALKLAREGFQPVLTGTDDDAAMAEGVLRVCPAARDICGLTSLCDIAALADGAAAAVGHDTGAAVLTALTGCPTQVIFPQERVGAVYRAFTPRTGESHAA